MTVPFNNIPQDLRVPLFYAEVDNSAANTATGAMRRLIVAQVNDTATAPEIGQLVLVSTLSMAKAIGGPGSMLAQMYATWRQSDPAGEVWCLPLLADAGAAATGKLTVTGTATEAGLLNVYVGGVRVRATVVAQMTAAELAAALVAAINAAVDLPVTAAAVDGVVTLTCKWRGASGNDIRLELNSLGRANGEATPAGVVVTVTAMAAGAGAPDQADALAALGDEPFEFICVPWNDATTLGAWSLAMDDSAGRWSWAKQLYGHVYSAQRGTLGELVAAGKLRNDQHLTVDSVEVGVPQPVWQVAAAFAARSASFISADPSRPTQTGVMVGIGAAPASERFGLTERQSLLTYGMATS